MTLPAPEWEWPMKFFPRSIPTVVGKFTDGSLSIAGDVRFGKVKMEDLSKWEYYSYAVSNKLQIPLCPQKLP